MRAIVLLFFGVLFCAPSVTHAATKATGKKAPTRVPSTPQPAPKKTRVPSSVSPSQEAALKGSKEPFEFTPAQQEMLKRWLLPVELDPDAKAEMPDPDVVFGGERRYWTVPGTSILSPVAFGAGWGDVFAAIGVQNRSRFGSRPDAVAGLGFGIGNPAKWIGIEVAASFYSLHRLLPWKSSGGVSIKAHRLLPENFAIGFGVDNAVQWLPNDNGRSIYFVASKAIVFSYDENSPFSLAALHFGIGNGQYREINDVILQRDKFHWFASAGIRLFKPVSLVANFFTSDLSLGLSIAPFRDVRLTINPNVQDILNKAGDGKRYMISIVYADSFFSPTFPI